MPIEVTDYVFEALARRGAFALPEHFTCRFLPPGFPCTIELQISVSERDGPIVERMTLLAVDSAHPIDAALLRGISLKKLVASAISIVGYSARDATLPSGNPTTVFSQPLLRGEVGDFYRIWRQARGGRRRVDDEFLKKVAEVYRQAMSRGDPPTLTVSEVLVASRSTAGRWVVEARRRGFLGGTVERRAGEVADKG